MTTLRTAPAARDDIEAIRRYSKATFGPKVAAEYLKGLSDAFSFLQRYPLAGAAEEELGQDMRGFSYRSHRVYYRVRGNELLVVRVLHTARDALTVFEQPHDRP